MRRSRTGPPGSRTKESGERGGRIPRIRETRAVTNTDEDTEKQVYRVEKVLLSSQVHGVVSGYSWIRADDGARSLAKSQVQGDVGAQKVDPQVGSTRASDVSKGKRLLP